MSRIEQLIDEIEEYVEGCKPAPFHNQRLLYRKSSCMNYSQNCA